MSIDDAFFSQIWTKVKLPRRNFSSKTGAEEPLWRDAGQKKSYPDQMHPTRLLNTN